MKIPYKVDNLDIKLLKLFFSETTDFVNKYEYTADLYARLEQETGQATGFKSQGSMPIAVLLLA